jgi:kumamolisin
VRYVIHLQAPVNHVKDLLGHLHILKFLRQKDLRTKFSPEKRMISFESSNPGIITHLKKKFGDQIVAILSDNHGKGLYRRPSRHMTRWPWDPKKPTTPPGLTPMQVAKAYNFPTPGASIKDKVVAIVELGGAFNPKDVLNYCKQMSTPSPRLYYHMVDGAKESPDPQGADGEVSLDIDVVAAVAPGVQILVVFAPNTSNGFIDAVAGMSTYFLKPDAVSISWGEMEGNWDAGSRPAMDNAIQACVNAGINVYVAAGDNGSSDGYVGNNVDYPGSSPYALSCGGTKLTLNSDGSRQAEVVWNEDLSGEGATGGGVSDYYTANGAGFSVGGKRTVPDISGNADPNSGYVVNVDGQQQIIGGTSAVAPLMAALNVLLNSNLSEPAKNLQKVFYANPNLFYDVVQGNNGAYSASTGYDMCSGLGVPDGTRLLQILKPSLVQRTVKFLKQPVSKLFVK